MTTGFFDGIDRIVRDGADSANPLAFRHYDPNEVVMGRRMEDHLRFAVACRHDADIRPEQGNFADNLSALEEITDYIGRKMETSKTRLLWGTANMFSHRRWMAGAGANPDPDVFAFAAATVKACMDATHRLGGQNYVLWGGREGYETLLNTDLGLDAALNERYGGWNTPVFSAKITPRFPASRCLHRLFRTVQFHSPDHEVC